MSAGRPLTTPESQSVLAAATAVWPSADHAEAMLASWDGKRLDGARDVVAAFEAIVVELTGGEPLAPGEGQRIFTLVTRGLGAVAVLRKMPRAEPENARVVRRLELRLQNATISLLGRVRGEIDAAVLGAHS